MSLPRARRLLLLAFAAIGLGGVCVTVLAPWESTLVSQREAEDFAGKLNEDRILLRVKRLFGRRTPGGFFDTRTSSLAYVLRVADLRRGADQRRLDALIGDDPRVRLAPARLSGGEVDRLETAVDEAVERYVDGGWSMHWGIKSERLTLTTPLLPDQLRARIDALTGENVNYQRGTVVPAHAG